MRNVGFMGASTAVRLLFGLLSFGVMARCLGAEEFGRVMTAMAASVLAGLIVNFGFATYALREIGAASRATSRQIMAGVLSAKLLLGVAMLCTALLVLPWLPERWRGLMALLLLAQVFDAVTDLLNVGFRATGRFSQETRVATVGALLQFGLIAGSLALAPKAMVAAAAYGTARAVVLVLTWRQQRDYFGGLRPSPWREGLARLRAARAFAADYGLQALFGQVDSIVLAHYFGPAAVGLYQAGMRLFLGGAQSASVLGNVVIPRLSALRARQQNAETEVARTQAAFIGVGIAGGLVLALLPEDLVTLSLGPDFAPLVTLLPLFGLLFILRMTAAGWGVLLTVHGQQTVRAQLTLMHWSVVAAVALLMLPHQGLQGWLLALIAGNSTLLLTYGVALHATGSERVAAWPATASLISCAVLVFLATHRAG